MSLFAQQFEAKAWINHGEVRHPFKEMRICPVCREMLENYKKQTPPPPK